MDTEKDRFHVASWWAETPEFVIDALRKQLEAAAAIWPELKDYAVAKRRDCKKSENA
jgi:hypothetical protein